MILEIIHGFNLTDEQTTTRLNTQKHTQDGLAEGTKHNRLRHNGGETIRRRGEDAVVHAVQSHCGPATVRVTEHVNKNNNKLQKNNDLERKYTSTVLTTCAGVFNVHLFKMSHFRSQSSFLFMC